MASRGDLDGVAGERSLAAGEPVGGLARRLRIPSRDQARRVAIEAFGLTSFYLLVVVFFSITSDKFLSFANALNILSNITLIGIVSIGQALAIISGGFDLSVTVTVPLGAVIYALLINHGLPIPMAMLLAVLSGSSLGLTNGLIIT